MARKQSKTNTSARDKAVNKAKNNMAASKGPDILERIQNAIDKADQIQGCIEEQEPFIADSEEVIDNKIIQLCQKYLIADQTDLILAALDNHLYSFGDIKNRPTNDEAFFIDKDLKVFFIFNDLAAHLAEQGERILITKEGTWWFTLTGESRPITRNQALRDIINKSEKKETNISPI